MTDDISRDLLARHIGEQSFLAGLAAGGELFGVDEDDIEAVVMPLEAAEAEAARGAMARFVRTAGVASGEALYRFAAGKKFHALPADQFGELGAAPAAYFNVFSGVALALWKALSPPSASNPPVLVTERPRELHDTIFERAGDGHRKIGGPTLGPATPTSTDSVPVFRAAGEAAAPAVPSFGPGTALGAPTLAQMRDMAPEERRQWSACFGFPTADDEATITTRAPDLGAGPFVQVREPQFGAAGEGVIPVFGDARGLIPASFMAAVAERIPFIEPPPARPRPPRRKR